jgi:hypothetical protein
MIVAETDRRRVDRGTMVNEQLNVRLQVKVPYRKQ